MPAFSEELKSLRRELGLKSARAFFDWLKERGVGFNYSYYMRLEQGGLPSEKVVQEIASACKGQQADRVVLAYCRSLFPKNAYLFPRPGIGAGAAPMKPDQSGAPSGQKELSPRQVAAIAAHESHYHLFLLYTLSRGPIHLREIEGIIAPKVLQSALAVLEEESILRKSEAGYEAVSLEARFPDAYNAELKEAYAKFDLWDETFGAQFALEQLLNKMLIRRVSGRYLTIIGKQLDTLFELVKSSDEVDKRHNDKVLQLKVVLRQGKLPG